MTPMFPRWGFLDKFDVNEYMARSLLLTVLLWAAGQAVVGAWVALRPDAEALPENHITIRPDIYLEKFSIPTPTIVPAQGSRTQPKVRAAASRIVLREADFIERDQWDPNGVPGGTGSEPASEVESGGDVPEFTGMGAEEPEIWLVVEREPELISIRQPEYPEIAREAGIEGRVIVRVLVGADGFVQAAEVIMSVLGLDEAALVAARTAVFRPAEMQGRAVATRIVIPIEFALHDH